MSDRHAFGDARIFDDPQIQARIKQIASSGDIGEVLTVTGNVVNNTDPANPVVTAAIPVAVWATGKTYGYGDMVKGSDAKPYVSIVAPNLAHDPTTSPTQWQVIGAGADPETTPYTSYFTDANVLRGFGSTYTNTSGHRMTVRVSLLLTYNGTSTDIEVSVTTKIAGASRTLNLPAALIGGAGTVGIFQLVQLVTFEVDPGGTYSVNVAGAGASMHQWEEIVH